MMKKNELFDIYSLLDKQVQENCENENSTSNMFC